MKDINSISLIIIALIITIVVILSVWFIDGVRVKDMKDESKELNKLEEEEIDLIEAKALLWYQKCKEEKIEELRQKIKWDLNFAKYSGNICIDSEECGMNERQCLDF